MKYLSIILLFISTAVFAAPGNMNSQYVIYNLNTSSLIQEGGKPKRIGWPVANGGPADHLESNLTLLELTSGGQPVYDEATEKLVSGMVVDLPNTEYRREWTITPLTQQELDNNAADAADAAERAQAKAVYLQLKNVDVDSLSNSEKNAHLQLLSRVVARLIRDSYGE